MDTDPIKISFVTTADTTGAGAATAAVNDVGAASQAAGVKEAAAATATAAAVTAAEADQTAAVVEGETAQMAAREHALEHMLKATAVFSGLRHEVHLTEAAGKLAGSTFAGLGPVFMGLALIMPLVIKAGEKLWEKLDDGADNNKEKIKALSKAYKDMTDAFASLANANRDAEDAAAKDAENRFGAAKRDISVTAHIDTNATKLDNAIALAQQELQLVRDKIALEQTSAALLTASGNEAVRLSAERAAIITKIRDMELQISDTRRKDAMDEAQRKVADAKKEMDAATELMAKSQLAYVPKAAHQQNLKDESDAINAKRLEDLKTLEEEAKALGETLHNLRMNPQGRTVMGPTGSMSDPKVTATEQKLEEVKKAIEKLQGAEGFKEQARKTAEAEGMNAEVGRLKADMDKASAAQQAAAKAEEDAAISLSGLKGQQAVASKSEKDVKNTQAMGELGKEVGAEIDQTIKVIVDEAKQRGVSSTPGVMPGSSPSPEAEAVGKLQALKNSTASDVSKAKDLQTIIQGILNNIIPNDPSFTGSLQKLLDQTKPQLDSLKDLQGKLDTHGDLVVTAINGIATTLKNHNDSIKDLQQQIDGAKDQSENQR